MWPLLACCLATTAHAQQSAKAQRPPTPAEIGEQYKETVEIRFDQPYTETKNPKQMVDVYLPKKRANDKPLPVVAFVHGGAWAGGSRAMPMAIACDLVASGDYVGVAVGYRLTGEAIWPAQIHDCKAAIRWIRSHAKELNIDPDRIGAFGGSAGGHLVGLLGTSGNVKTLDGKIGKFADLPSNVTCVVDICGPSDMTQPMFVGPLAKTSDPAVKGLLGGELADRLEMAKEASPITYVSKESPPTLLIHGTKDVRVDFKQSERFDAALKNAGASSLLIPLVNIGHDIKPAPVMMGRVRQFWDLHLRGVKSEISTAPIEGL